MAIDVFSVAQWARGTWLSIPANSKLDGVCFDARLAQPGELFVALAGVDRDGHEYLDQAHAQGAAAALVERPVDSSLPQLLVSDTRQALQQMARAHRQCFLAYCVELLAVVGKPLQNLCYPIFYRRMGRCTLRQEIGIIKLASQLPCWD